MGCASAMMRLREEGLSHARASHRLSTSIGPIPKMVQRSAHRAIRNNDHGLSGLADCVSPGGKRFALLPTSGRLNLRFVPGALAPHEFLDLAGRGLLQRPEDHGRGALKWARWVRQKPMISSPEASAWGFRVTKAQGLPPHIGSGRATSPALSSMFMATGAPQRWVTPSRAIAS
jgi:hypothetical protein